MKKKLQIIELNRMDICGKLTKSATLCKNSKNCHLHRQIKDDLCSICLCPIRRTRGTRQLSCGHLYHKKCINEWKDSSKNTCPICRQSFDLSKYKVTITIENTENEEIQSLTLPYSNIVQLFEGLDFTGLPEELDSAQLQFDVNTLNDLETLIRDLGIDNSVLEVQ
jgi:hypothetical protein